MKLVLPFYVNIRDNFLSSLIYPARFEINLKILDRNSYEIIINATAYTNNFIEISDTLCWLNKNFGLVMNIDGLIHLLQSIFSRLQTSDTIYGFLLFRQVKRLRSQTSIRATRRIPGIIIALAIWQPSLNHNPSEYIFVSNTTIDPGTLPYFQFLIFEKEILLNAIRIECFHQNINSQPEQVLRNVTHVSFNLQW